MSPQPYTEDQFVEQPAMALLASLGWRLPARSRKPSVPRVRSGARPRARSSLLRFYGELFQGDEAETLGDREVARASYERAARLYPRAQSPRVALSRLSHGVGDKTGALSEVRRALDGARQDGDDPWWSYESASGRHVEQLLRDFPAPFLDPGPDPSARPER